MTDPAEDRYERERAYHDHRYEHGTRQRADKYYALDAGGARYAEVLGGIGPGETVLEYGCGTGSAAFGLAQRGARVTGIDISPVAIAEATAEAERQGVGATFVEMNAEALDFADGTFDVVCGSGVLHHLDLERALPEVARVMAPGGWATFAEPLGSNPVINLYRRLTPKMRTPDEHPLLEADFERARQSFGVVEIEVFNLLALAGVVFRKLPGGRRVVAALHAADGWLFRRLPFTRRWAWVVVVRLAEPRPRR